MGFWFVLSLLMRFSKSIIYDLKADIPSVSIWTGIAIKLQQDLESGPVAGKQI